MLPRLWESIGRALARGTLALWDTVGIFQEPEELIAWVNEHEHNVLSGDPEAMSKMAELVAYTYYNVAQEDRETFLVMWSVALFEVRQFEADLNNDGKPEMNFPQGRTYEFLETVLTQPNEASVAAVDNMGSYADSFDEVMATELGAYHTFGTTELEFEQLEEFSEKGEGRLFTEFVVDERTGQGVFIMTGAQLNYAQRIKTGEITLQQALEELPNVLGE